MISVYRSSPTQIPGTQWSWGNSGVHKVSSGLDQQSYAGSRTDGTLWVWGN